MTPKLCACHGVPMRLGKRQRYCIVKLHDVWKRASQKYRATPGGKAFYRRRNQRRIYVGQDDVGVAKTPEQAQMIRAHIRKRTDAFNARQSRRAETESVSPS